MDLNQFDPQIIVREHDGLTVGDKIGAGGQKAVWRSALHAIDYALKVINADQDSKERAKREVEVMRVCISPYLPRVGPLPLTEIALSDDNSVLYYLEEYIDGVCLVEVREPLSVAEIQRLGVCVATALHVLSDHGFIHRDVKPGNIMRRSSNGDYVLLDAGLVLDAAGPSITATGNVVGTRNFLSPDQLTLAKRELDFRSDMFALGMTMYMGATAQHPFWNSEMPRGDILHNIVNVQPPDPRAWRPDLSEALCAVIMRLLEKPRHLRYSRFEPLIEELNGILTQ